MMRKIFICLSIASFFLACSKTEQAIEIEKPLLCDSAAYIYLTDIKPILETSCNFGTTCHSAGSGNADFSTYAGIAAQARLNTLRYRLLVPVENPVHMPVGFDLNPCDLFKLTTWLNQGFPEK